MTSIEPSKLLNSLRDHSVDKAAQQSHPVRPRAPQPSEVQAPAAKARPAPQRADHVDLSAQARQVSAKPAAVETEPKPAAAARAAVAPSPTQAAKGKPVNLLA